MSDQNGRSAPAEGARVRRWLLIAISLLIATRLAYHLLYLIADPFALATFSDGQLYEDAARDILAHPPLGSEPFYLQGLYAYALALPMAVAPQVVIGLLFQLVLAAVALVLFYRVASSELGTLTGSVSTLVLLLAHELAFFENKYLSVSLGVSCNLFALWAMGRCRSHKRPTAALLAGVASGLTLLGRPNLCLALPFNALALWVLARGQRVSATPRMLAFVGGVLLALAPMALRNQVVTGRPDVFPSHGGAIPFFIGNNPQANGRWNTAGGLLSGQVGREREELAAHFGIAAGTAAQVDAAIGRKLRDEAFAFIRTEPAAWLGLEARKLWLTLGNHRFARDYDVLGESELIGSLVALGLPFGVVLGLSAIGFVALLRRAAQFRVERARLTALLLVVTGQLIAVLAASLYAFASSQNRAPLYAPLALCAGPGVLALAAKVRAKPQPMPQPMPPPIWTVGIGALLLGALLCAQAFWPRTPSLERPSSVHYYNLAVIEETLARDPAAAAHYAQAVTYSPRQPLFRLRWARVLRRMGRMDEASRALTPLEGDESLPRELRIAVASERGLLNAGSRIAPR